MVCMSLDMQAALRPSKWFCEIIGSHRCLDTLVSMSRHVIYAIEQSCNTVDPLENSIRLKLQKSDGR
jgi:hypothetical protein